MAGSVDFSVERGGNIFIITLHRAPENRLNVKFCQDLIRTFHDIQRELGPGSEGAVITRGSDYKFFCTVCNSLQQHLVSLIDGIRRALILMRVTPTHSLIAMASIR